MANVKDPAEAHRVSKRTAYHRKYWRDHAEKRRRQKRESNANVRAQRREAQALKRPKVFDRCQRCRRRLRDKAARLIGYGRVCATRLFSPPAGQIDWIGYSTPDIAIKRAALRVVARAPKRTAGDSQKAL